MPYARDTILAGKLRVVRLLGEGGLGEVYEVEHQLTRHRRALKVLKPQWRSDKELVERFLREASAAGHIGNPHIVEAFDAGTLDDGSPYLLMEMLEGQSLDLVLRWHGRLDPGVAVQLLLQVCDAIAAAHAAGIIHRDLKPENLFLLKREGHSFVKVLDFGISKFDTGRTGHVKVTDTNTALGTPLYMSPEQMRASRDVDERADLYSLGVILYECIAGAPPFNADNFAELAASVLRGECKPLDEVMSETPKQLARVVAQAMAVDRSERFPSAEAFAEAIEPFASPGVTSLTELPAKVRVPEPRFAQPLTVSPWGPTGRPDEDTTTGGGDSSTAHGRPTEDANPVGARNDNTTVLTRRWPLLVAATMTAVIVGFIAVGTSTEPTARVAARLTEQAVVTDAGPRLNAPIIPTLTAIDGLSVVDAGPSTADVPDASVRGATSSVLAKAARLESKKPVWGLVSISCPKEENGCAFHLPNGTVEEAPRKNIRVPNGKVFVTTRSGKKTKPYNLVFLAPGEEKVLRADMERGIIELGP